MLGRSSSDRGSDGGEPAVEKQVEVSREKKEKAAVDKFIQEIMISHLEITLGWAFQDAGSEKPGTIPEEIKKQLEELVRKWLDSPDQQFYFTGQDGAKANEAIKNENFFADISGVRRALMQGENIMATVQYGTNWVDSGLPRPVGEHGDPGGNTTNELVFEITIRPKVKTDFGSPPVVVEEIVEVKQTDDNPDQQAHILRGPKDERYKLALSGLGIRRAGDPLPTRIFHGGGRVKTAVARDVMGQEVSIYDAEASFSITYHA